MTSTSFQQPTNSTTNIMSIGAITLPCQTVNETAKNFNNVSPHDSSFQHLGSALFSSGYSAKFAEADNHWISLDRETDIYRGYPQHTKRTRISSEDSITSPPMFSSSSSTISDHESDSSPYSPKLFSSKTYDRRDSNNGWPIMPIYTKRNHEDYAQEVLASECLLRKFDLEEENQSFDYKSSKKSDAIATRRARNKLASAKYRAKKQALTHAMQERIMQLATQVMSLRDELDQTRKSEAELFGRYKRLMLHCNQQNTATNSSQVICSYSSKNQK